MVPPPTVEAGPSNYASQPHSHAALLRQFVIDYLQRYGFEKAVEMFTRGLAEAGEKDADGEDDGPAASAAPAGPAGPADGAEGREAVFRAAGPVPIESLIKRNIPQAQAVSASAISERVGEDLEAQARYIIEQMAKRQEGKDKDGDGDGDDGVKETKPDTKPKESLLDTSDRVSGYRVFRRWVDGGLDLWKPELDALSYPLFAHTYLDLIQYGFARAARDFFSRHASHHRALHPQELAALQSITDRQNLEFSSMAQRLLSEKYIVAMSRNTHDLLIQWLSGAGLDEEWEAGLHSSAGRAKEAIKAIVFNHLAINVAPMSRPLDPVSLSSSTGLISSLLPKGTSVDQFNATGQLKLGPPPMTEKLREQVARTLADEEGNAEAGTSSLTNGHANGDGDVDMDGPRMSPRVEAVKVEADLLLERDPDLISPEEGETVPPIPAVFRISDLKKEVEAVKDRRKTLRLGVSEGKDGTNVLPSVLAFTVFDNNEGLTSVEFSKDSSLMAAGSPESCIRLWSMKGEKLKAKSIDPSDGSLVEDNGLPVRKLIAHSGPVYSLSFDPVYGSARPPSSLLSSSQDGTVRLWSLDTYSNLVVYRGHGRDPVWDVEWGPFGVYFATASRDKTARLWSSDRVTPLRMYTGHLSDVNCIKFHPNSMYLASGSYDRTCRLWDVQRGTSIRLFLGHTDAVTCMAMSPDGKLLASAGLDASIWLWDLGSSRPIKKMTGHAGAIHSLAFSAESSLLVSGGQDCTVRTWDVKSAGGESKGRILTSEGLGLGVGSSRRSSAQDGAALNLNAMGMEKGELPLGQRGWDEGNATSDLLASFRTKRTPVVKTHFAPRNLCMVAGAFVPPGEGNLA